MTKEQLITELEKKYEWQREIDGFRATLLNHEDFIYSYEMQNTYEKLTNRTREIMREIKNLQFELWRC